MMCAVSTFDIECNCCGECEYPEGDVDETGYDPYVGSYTYDC